MSLPEAPIHPAPSDEYFVIPPPVDAFTITPDTIETMRDITADGIGRLGLTSEIPLLETDRGVFAETTKRLCQAVPEIFEQSADYLGTANMNIAIDLNPVFPTRTQRIPHWHTDASTESRKGIILADGLPTEFAHGMIPKTHPLARRFFLEDGTPVFKAENEDVQQAIDTGLLQTLSAKPYVATGFETDSHFHRGTVNHTDTVIHRFFMRIIALRDDER